MFVIFVLKVRVRVVIAEEDVDGSGAVVHARARSSNNKDKVRPPLRMLLLHHDSPSFVRWLEDRLYCITRRVADQRALFLYCSKTFAIYLSSVCV